jgi:hypothetical protein
MILADELYYYHLSQIENLSLGLEEMKDEFDSQKDKIQQRCKLLTNQ